MKTKREGDEEIVFVKVCLNKRYLAQIHSIESDQRKNSGIGTKLKQLVDEHTILKNINLEQKMKLEKIVNGMIKLYHSFYNNGVLNYRHDTFLKLCSLYDSFLHYIDLLCVRTNLTTMLSKESIDECDCIYRFIKKYGNKI